MSRSNLTLTQLSLTLFVTKLVMHPALSRGPRTDQCRLQTVVDLAQSRGRIHTKCLVRANVPQR